MQDCFLQCPLGDIIIERESGTIRNYDTRRVPPAGRLRYSQISFSELRFVEGPSSSPRIPIFARAPPSCSSHVGDGVIYHAAPRLANWQGEGGRSELAQMAKHAAESMDPAGYRWRTRKVTRTKKRVRFSSAGKVLSPTRPDRLGSLANASHPSASSIPQSSAGCQCSQRGHSPETSCHRAQ